MQSSKIIIILALFVFLMPMQDMHKLLILVLLALCYWVDMKYNRERIYSVKLVPENQNLDEEINTIIGEIDKQQGSIPPKETPLGNLEEQQPEKRKIDAPLYENLEDLKWLNYYNAEGLNCAYDLGFSRDFSNFREMYHLMGCNGDTKLANRMKFQSLKNKAAMDNRARYDRTSSQPYFTDELAIEEKRIWWENPDVYDSVM